MIISCSSPALADVRAEKETNLLSSDHQQVSSSQTTKTAEIKAFSRLRSSSVVPRTSLISFPGHMARSISLICSLGKTLKKSPYWNSGRLLCVSRSGDKFNILITSPLRATNVPARRVKWGPNPAVNGSLKFGQNWSSPLKRLQKQDFGAADNGLEWNGMEW